MLVSPVLVTVGRVGDAAARANVSRGAALAPVTFVSTGSEQTYTVPAGATTLEVQAVGANGGAPSQPMNPDAPTGGTGGMVIGELAVGAGSPVTPGETLYLGVGGTPTGRAGGFNGGGSAVGGNGNGGGGATDVRPCSPASTSCANGTPSPLTRLIVAAGGGGAGGCDSESCNVPCDISCGSGGSAGQSGFDAGLEARLQLGQPPRSRSPAHRPRARSPTSAATTTPPPARSAAEQAPGLRGGAGAATGPARRGWMDARGLCRQPLHAADRRLPAPTRACVRAGAKEPRQVPNPTRCSSWSTST